MISAIHVPLAANAEVTKEIETSGYSRNPLTIDQDVASAFRLMSDAAWSLPRDQYYSGGDRFRTLNRFVVNVDEVGVSVMANDSTEPYDQLPQYNTELGGTPRSYNRLKSGVAHTLGIAKIIAHHIISLPITKPGAGFNVNLHLKRFLASPHRPCDTSPSGFHKDGEKYLATHLVTTCGVEGGEIVITDNGRTELDRFTMREMAECYLLDDEKVWHMLTPVGVSGKSTVAFRDIALFDILPVGWRPA